LEELGTERLNVSGGFKRKCGGKPALPDLELMRVEFNPLIERHSTQDHISK